VVRAAWGGNHEMRAHLAPVRVAAGSANVKFSGANQHNINMQNDILNIKN
jgi:uncharacterized protein CbrC (UPF0167 family)